MDEALQLDTYLPQSFANAAEREYLDFLWSTFRTNYDEKHYEFASLAFHLLYMSFVSFSIWQIKLAQPDKFSMAMIGFQIEVENTLEKCDSPFKFYSRLKESQIFRFLKLIGCTNDHVGRFATFVKDRNDIAHPSGNVFFNDQDTLDRKLSRMITEVRNIHTHMRQVIQELYIRFLDESSDPETREYADARDEISANLIHANYMSTADLTQCAKLNITRFDTHPNRFDIFVLHETLNSLVEEAQDKI